MGMFDFIGDIFGTMKGAEVSRDNARATAEVNAANIAFQQQTNAQNWAREDAINAQNRADTADYFSKNMDFQNFWATQSANAQKEAAQNSILWRVEDAERAGVHPMYALGMPGISLAPSSVGGVAAGGSSSFTPSAAPQYGAVPQRTNMRSFGQDISRAIASMETKEERARRQYNDMIVSTENAQRIERGELENDLLRLKIAKEGRDQIGPPAPDIESVNEYKGPRLSPVPAQPVIGARGQPEKEPGQITDYGFARNRDGGLSVVYSTDMKQRTEDSLIDEVLWNVRNRIVPFFTAKGGGFKKPSLREHPLPTGQDWAYDRWSNSFRPYYVGTRKFVPFAKSRRQQ